MGSRAIISIDIGKSPQRRRFSLGHEIGHWIYHRGQLLVCRSEEIGGFTGFQPRPGESRECCRSIRLRYHFTQVYFDSRF